MSPHSSSSVSPCVAIRVRLLFLTASGTVRPSNGPSNGCKGKMPAVGSPCQSRSAESPLRTGTQDSRTGGGSTVSPPSPLLLLGAFSCVGDLRTNEGQARHVGLTAGEGVALSNVVQSRPAPGTAGLRGPDLLPIPEATGLAPPCSLGRSENL